MFVSLHPPPPNPPATTHTLHTGEFQTLLPQAGSDQMHSATVLRVPLGHRGLSAWPGDRNGLRPVLVQARQRACPAPPFPHLTPIVLQRRWPRLRPVDANGGYKAKGDGASVRSQACAPRQHILHPLRWGFRPPPPPSPLHFHTYVVTLASPDSSGPALCVNSFKTRQEEHSRSVWHAISTCGEKVLFLSVHWPECELNPLQSNLRRRDSHS